MAAGVAAVFSTAVAAQAPLSVKIGVLNDQSGVYADFGGKWSVEAARMAIEDMKRELGDIKVELVSADHQNKADIGASIARQWYDVDGVDMITELTTSSVALAVQAIAKEKKKLDMVVGAATARLALRLPLGLRHTRARRRPGRAIGEGRRR